MLFLFEHMVEMILSNLFFPPLFFFSFFFFPSKSAAVVLSSHTRGQYCCYREMSLKCVHSRFQSFQVPPMEMTVAVGEVIREVSRIA